MVIRQRYEWKLRSRTLLLGERAMTMAVLNVTPDSFSDGGKYTDPDRAAERAVELDELGADIIDIGAESTRPGAEKISEAEELRRLVPVLKRLEGRLKKAVISVDTYKAAVALKATEYGAEIINDPSGFSWDENMAKTAAQTDVGFILNHMRGTPETWAKLGPIKDLILNVRQDLEAAISRTLRAGVEKKRLVIDPGIGFGKRREQNAELIAHIPEFASLGTPVMIGPSRKSFLKQETPIATEFASAAAITACLLNGAHIIRMHDLAAMKSVMEVAEAIFKAGIVVEKEEPEEKPKQNGPRHDGPDPGVNRVHETSKRPHQSLNQILRPGRGAPRTGPGPRRDRS